MFYLSELAKIIEGDLQGEDLLVRGFNTDTRVLTEGQLFIALPGERFDGHDFLPSACQKKAAAAIVSRDVQVPIPKIKVKDTKLALGKIALFHRKRYDLPIIAVTGSCGKTTTKAMIATILGNMAPTLAPPKSFNNEIGVPLTLMHLNDHHRYAVIEMGANRPGEIEYLSQIALQTVSVITNVAPAHLAGFKTIEGVAKAKGEIYTALGKQGLAIINQDDPFSDYWKNLLGGRRELTFGIKQKADIQGQNISLNHEGKPVFEVLYPGGKFSICLPLLGIHNVMNALAAIAATYAVGASPEAMVTGLSEVSAVSKRLVRYSGLEGAIIIDDTYNANPLSVTAALETLAQAKGEKIFVFGDMGELGDQANHWHVEIGEKAKYLGINKILACGELSRVTICAFGRGGYHYENQAALIKALKPQLHPDAIVLIKGSRSAQMENIVHAIIQE
jgi:UDP-N-acetylmuramoyl-tripeptide--D-alanyl-D-alanine ligase